MLFAWVRYLHKGKVCGYLLGYQDADYSRGAVSDLERSWDDRDVVSVLFGQRC